MTTVEFNNDDILLKDPNTNLYMCSTCSYYTPLKNSYIKHVKTDKHKLNVNPLKCNHCNDLFYTKMSYNNHMKTCIIPDINENVSIDENSIVVDDKSQYENKYQDDYDDYYHDEDLGLLLQKFGNQYDRLMIKYMLLFLLKIKENMVPVNILLIFVFFMWTR
jgi:uncharacterized C2H2 Zn-finger protein